MIRKWVEKTRWYASFIIVSSKGHSISFQLSEGDNFDEEHYQELCKELGKFIVVNEG